MRSRVCFYSLTGTTRLLAEALAARTVADMCEIRCPRYSEGAWVYLRGGWDALRGARPPVDADTADEPVDCLLIGGPVWAGRPAPPLMSFLAGLSAPPDRIGIFMTGADDPEKSAARRSIPKVLGREPDAWLMMRAGDVRRGAHSDEIEDFLRDLSMHSDPKG